MRKATLIALSILFVLTACAPSAEISAIETGQNDLPKVTPSGDNGLPVTASPTPSELPPLDDTIGGTADLEFGYYYSGGVNDIIILAHIAGYDKAEEFFDFVEKNKFDENGNIDFSRLWLREGIEALGITKDEFIKTNDELKPTYIENGAEWAIFSDAVIEALFLEDKEARTKALQNPNVLYCDGKFFSIYDLLTLPSKDLETIPFSKQELLDFSQEIYEKMKSAYAPEVESRGEDNSEETSYFNYLQPYLDELLIRIMKMPEQTFPLFELAKHTGLTALPDPASPLVYEDETGEMDDWSIEEVTIFMFDLFLKEMSTYSSDRSFIITEYEGITVGEATWKDDLGNDPLGDPRILLTPAESAEEYWRVAGWAQMKWDGLLGELQQFNSETSEQVGIPTKRLIKDGRKYTLVEWINAARS